MKYLLLDTGPNAGTPPPFAAAGWRLNAINERITPLGGGIAGPADQPDFGKIQEVLRFRLGPSHFFHHCRINSSIPANEPGNGTIS
jgi:hypothetical protein